MGSPETGHLLSCSLKEAPRTPSPCPVLQALLSSAWPQRAVLDPMAGAGWAGAAHEDAHPGTNWPAAGRGWRISWCPPSKVLESAENT